MTGPDLNKRCFRVTMSDGKTLIIHDRYSSLTDFMTELKRKWERSSPVNTNRFSKDDEEIMINPAFIVRVDGPHAELYQIDGLKW